MARFYPKCGRGLVKMLVLMLLCVTLGAYAQTPVMKGVIRDQNGNPLVGVTVIEKGTTNGTSSNTDGSYSISLRGTNPVLVFQSIGYTPQEFTVGKGQTRLDVTLKEDAISLDAVVAIGYGSVKQKDLTTAVSIVSTKDLDTRPITSASAALQGKAAGVQVVQPNGQPGSGMIVRVRGASSISSSNDPLYVVDGVPVGEGNYAIEYLSPNDIETIQVLKDASSAAIYGSRAANGVVLITTKQGHGANKPQINVTSMIGISHVAKTYDVLNYQQYRELMEETGAVKGLPTDLKDETDWFDETYQTGVNQNYHFSVSNGNGKTNYNIGGGYNKETGVLPVAYSQRYNVKAGIESELFKWISVGASTTYSRYAGNGIISGAGSNRAGVVLSIINTPTYAKVWDEDNPGWYWTKFYGANITTPAENLARTENNKTQTDRLLLSGNVTLKFHKNLDFKSTVTMDRRWVHTFSFLDPIKTSYGRTTHGSASDTRSDDMRMIYDNILTYRNVFGGRHHLEVMAGTSATVSVWEELSGSRTHFSADYGNAIIGLNGGNNGGLRGQSQSKSEWAIMSYLGRVSYNFDDRYLFTANFRADGSSKLAPKHRWGYFPSFSAAWRLSGERFLSDVGWLDDLKIRAGWGQTGNQSGLDDYAYLQKYNTNYYDWTDSKYVDATPTVGSRSNLKNEDLTWETTTQTNVGIDLTVLKGRLTVSLDAYYKYTKDMLMSVPLPSPNPSIYRNEGEMSNKGFEVVVSSRNIVKRGFEWSTDFNLSLNRNRLEKLQLQQVYYYTQTSESVKDYAIRMTPGQPLSMFWGYKALGVDPETGNMFYEDAEGNPTLTPSDKDKRYIGNANPKFTFGMTNNFSWKGLNLNILLTGSYGNDIFNASKIEMVGMNGGGNQITDVLRRWRIPGQITDIPRAGSATNNLTSTRWIEDGSYIKIKNITLSYDIRSPKLEKVNISKIQPYVTLQNFFTFTDYSGYDPEVSQYSSATSMGVDWGTYPNVKTVVFGLNVTF